MERFQNLPQHVKIAIIAVSIFVVSASLTVLFLKGNPMLHEILSVDLLHDVPAAPPS